MTASLIDTLKAGAMFQKLNFFQMSGPYCHDLIMLTHNLLVTARRGFLVVWDVRLPDPVRHIKLGDVDATQSVTLMTHLSDTIACSFGNQIRLVHFPMLTDKED